MKKIIVLLVFFLSLSFIYAQEKKYKFQQSDIEVAFGGSFLPNPITNTYLSMQNLKYYTEKYNQSGSFYYKLEYRYNLKKSPFSIGLQIAETQIYTKYDSYSDHSVFNISLVSDYNFKPNTPINPYIGATLGCITGDGSVRSYIAPSARAGIKLYRHINVGLEYKFYFKEDAHAVAYVGFYF